MHIWDVFTPVHVVRGKGAAFLPSDFFEEITLSSLDAGCICAWSERASYGTVSDPSVHKVEFEFWTPIGGKSGKGKWIGFTGPVTNGEFSVNIKFPPEQDLVMVSYTYTCRDAATVQRALGNSGQ